ncbi:MAG: TPM domain-containing protein [Saprospiraceae bacterium]
MMNSFLKKIFFLLLYVAPITLGAQSGNSIPEIPNPPRLVTDYTSTLQQTDVNALEQKLLAYNDSTSSQISIVVINNLGDYEINQYATELALKWNIGQKGKDNGLLILWSTGDRKVFIATGYGFEEKVPDAICKRIVDRLIIPNFRDGLYYQGLDLATDEIIARMSGTFLSDPDQNQTGTISINFIIFILILIIVIIYFLNKFGDGGGKGGGGRGFWNSNIPWIISNTGSSGWGGGGWGSGGGSSGGGGFGGFGGGGFGGGGAGGDY